MKNPVVWFEVVGKDGGTLRKFYADLFGWKIDSAAGDMDYGLVPMEIPSYNLTFAYFTDPQGHLVGLSKGAVQ